MRFAPMVLTMSANLKYLSSTTSFWPGWATGRRGKSVLNESGDRAPRWRARGGLAAGKQIEMKPTPERSLSNMSSWVRGDREWV